MDDYNAPTFNNVAREFIFNTMLNAEFNRNNPSFKTIFLEPEANDYVVKVMNDNIDKYTNNERVKWIKGYKNYITEESSLMPALIIKDYKNFFNLLAQYYAGMINLYKKRDGGKLYWPDDFIENVLKYIWERATSYDFNNPEQFIQRNIDFINDNTFDIYDNEVLIGELNAFPNYVFTVKNRVSYNWDETPKDLLIRIYKKTDYMENKEHKLSYNLPTIRYGIYNINGIKTCYIGAIQSSTFNKYPEEINITMYGLNNGMIDIESEEYKKYLKEKNTLGAEVYYPENISDVGISIVFALGIFINFLHQNNITRIIIPSIQCMRYNSHEVADKLRKEEFEERWNEYKRWKMPKTYQSELERYTKLMGKADLISKNTTEKFIRAFRRIGYYYPEFNILSYPDELDNFMYMEIPKVTSYEEIKSPLLREVYNAVDNLYQDQNKRKIK